MVEPKDTLFYLGTHEPSWLAKTDVPLFISFRRIMHRKSLPAATCNWSIDSGGFTELSMYGAWQTTPKQYVDTIRHLCTYSGMPTFVAPQDYMCEPLILHKTGLSVREHQRRTTASYQQLQGMAPEIPWIPVIQGWLPSDYQRHIEMYDQENINLHTLPTVGIGSVCRRQSTAQIIPIVQSVAAHNINLHGFGVKTTGLSNMPGLFTSVDSMSWSITARRENIRLLGHTHGNCANCLEYALQWRRKVINSYARRMAANL